jgi:GrpB-like predicted nucleotidyltransferase (UPF0157 family)
MTFDADDPRWVDEGIVVVDYDADWPARFDAQAAVLDPLLATWLIEPVHHVGSTSVPGLSAKPVIDILGPVASLSGSEECIEVLRGAGWFYTPYLSDTMHWFCYPSPWQREFHLHLVVHGSTWYRQELAFRDYLRAHPQAAQEYEQLKLGLAKRHPNDREAYTEGKAEMVLRISADAIAWVDAGRP